jgi:glycosyltransferase involved in cell wall biosynthesis
MPVATVIVPTHNHVDTLRYSIPSALAQTLGDLELFIVGDGVGSDTRDVVAELQKADKRIRFFDLPKAPRHGEANWHTAVTHASGRFVAYLGDDDLWMPNHLETMSSLLEQADFAHTLHVGVGPDGALFVLAADLSNPLFRRRMIEHDFNRFDLSFAGHTLAAYRRLPSGWEPPPATVPWGDLHMWRKFLSQPWCRARSSMVPTGICTQTHRRPHLTQEDRLNELANWQKMVNTPAFRERLWRLVAHTFASALVEVETKAVMRPRTPVTSGAQPLTS